MHNLYGAMQAKATHEFMTTQPFINSDRRPFVMTSSSFAGTGRWASHSLGHNHATWEEMELSIPGVMLQNVSTSANENIFETLLFLVGLWNPAERCRSLRLLWRTRGGAVRPVDPAGCLLSFHAKPLPPALEGALQVLRKSAERLAFSSAAEVQPTQILLHSLLRGSC